MSSEQSLDPQLIEQTKQQIRSLVNEIAQLAKSESTPEAFYAEFLPRVVSALAAVGGVIWTLEEQGRLAIKYQVNLRESRLAEVSEEDQARHGRLLHQVMAAGEGALVPPRSGSGEEDQAANPTDHLLVLGPLKTELEVVGVVEIFQRPEAGPTVQKGYLRFLLQMCDLATDFLKSRQLRHFSDRQILWTQLEEFARLVHASLNPRDTAYTIVNEGRRLIECDRVSVALRHGRRCVTEAVSGQDLFDKRSNTVRLLNRLATVVVASGEPVWYTGDAQNLAPQVEDAVQEYVDETHSKMVAVLPLARPIVEKDKERADDVAERPSICGALIVEQIEDSRIPPKMVQRVEVVARHSSVAIANAVEHENLFLMPVWRTLGKARWLTEARRLPKVIAISVAIVALIVALFVVPADFGPHSTGTLEPVDKREVFAQTTGEVVEVLVKHRDIVEADQLLMLLRNHTLNQQILDLEGKLNSTDKEISKVTRQLLARRLLTRDDETRLQGEKTKLVADRESYAGQLKELRRQVEQLKVKSPMRGQVISWDLDQKLLNRPVQPGQVLVKLADPDGPWQLELRVPEDRMGYIQLAQNAIYDGLRGELRAAMTKSMRDSVCAALVAEVKKNRDKAPSSPAEEPPASPPSPAADSPSGHFMDPSPPPAGELKSSEPNAAEPKLGEPKPAESKSGEAKPAEPKAVEPAESLKPGAIPSPDDKPSASMPGLDNVVTVAALQAASDVGDAPAAKSAGPSGDAMAPSPSPESKKEIVWPSDTKPSEPLPPADAAKPMAESNDAAGSEKNAPPTDVAAEKPAVDDSPSADDKPSPLAGLDKELAEQVESMLPERLAEAVQAELDKTPNEKLRAKLKELTGRDVEDRIPVEFTLMTSPSEKHQGWIYEIGRAADVHGEEGNTVLVKVAIDKEEIDLVNRHQGATVSAKIACGRQSLGFVLFHDLIAWARKMAFRWL
jgi:multidrug efflux pump subunit AcrA (membrane-fusion protein)